MTRGHAPMIAIALFACSTLAAAQGKLGEVVVTTEKGAEIFVDGQPMGTAPLPFPLAVQPGERTIEARLGGRVAKVTLVVESGVKAAAALSFAAAGPAAAAPAADPAPPPAAEPGPADEPAGEPAPASEDSGVEVDVATGGKREPFLDWGRRQKLAWIGGGLTVLGVAGGVTFLVLANNNHSIADDHGDAIRVQKEKDGVTGPVCEAPPTSAYEGACDKFADARDLGDSQQVLSIVSFALAGVAAGATVAYYFVDSKKEPASGAIVPAIGPGFAGIAAVGAL